MVACYLRLEILLRLSLSPSVDNFADPGSHFTTCRNLINMIGQWPSAADACMYHTCKAHIMHLFLCDATAITYASMNGHRESKALLGPVRRLGGCGQNLQLLSLESKPCWMLFPIWLVLLVLQKASSWCALPAATEHMVSQLPRASSSCGALMP